MAAAENKDTLKIKAMAEVLSALLQACQSRRSESMRERITTLLSGLLVSTADECY
jgi:hypothetical protein